MPCFFHICLLFSIKNNMKKWGVFVRRLLYSFFALVLIVILPMVKIFPSDNMELIMNAFVGKKSEYQGFIEVWNIDTFESGNQSKTDFLKKVSAIFEKDNRGLYVIVKNMSEAECVNSLSRGYKPDVFSCSYGVAEKIKEYLTPINSEVKGVYSNLLEAGKIDGEQYAIPWCMGNYYLISTKKRIENFADDSGSVLLKDLVFTAGQELKKKNDTEIVYSVGFASDKYNMSKYALYTYNDKGLNSISNLSFDKSANSTQYSAYCDFITGKTNILLGSQRDVYRISLRESLGKIDETIIEVVSGFSDLIQFVMVADCEDVKQKYVQEFAMFLASAEVQAKVLDMGMFSVNKNVIEGKNNGTMRNIAPQNISDYKCVNLFSKVQEIENLKSVF